MEFLDAIGQLIDQGLAVAVLAAVVVAFLTDRLTSGRARDREVTRERELTDRALGQIDSLTDTLRDMSDNLERQTDIQEARQQAARDR